MNKISVNPMFLLGMAVKINLKAGGSFYFKVTGVGVNYIHGYDDESSPLTIAIDDIDYIGGTINGNNF